MAATLDQRIAAARARLDDALGLRPARPATPPPDPQGMQPPGALAGLPQAPEGLAAPPPAAGGLGALQGAL